jgi:hypothetical protein
MAPIGTAAMQLRIASWHPSDVTEGVEARAYEEDDEMRWLGVTRLGEMGGVGYYYALMAPTDFVVIREEWSYDRPIYQPGVSRESTTIDTVYFCAGVVVSGEEVFADEVSSVLAEAVDALAP